MFVLDNICCAGIVRAGWFRTQKVRTLSGELYNIGRDGMDEVYIQDAGVRACDLTATNGVVHIVDKVLMRRRPQPFEWDFDMLWEK